ncbi:GNAT family N-acetyltransferase [Actinosynnema sp. NPDC047251]|uniref:Spore associated protein n=1 Tax=Saccharothrix espanaensis (strain ATCC 51144 / DSM 44229 / JCM 9112 / NBRC 15066 / NRRL 15764) TaxID=1179773 RepID=K0K4K1_SACES|nr:GNAT family N-acetyltransferase [Saccharothrix espanaensis]CCH32522.1 Spore associated protein [Saccharothrix espanaensis DSM 44229]
MTSEPIVTAPRHQRDWDQYSRLAAESFGGDHRDLTCHRSRGPAAVAVVDDEVIGGAVALRAHQFFGGSAVPTGCVADVCVRPEWRGRGVARRVIDTLMDRTRADGGVLSTLWTPATGVYRRWGWEVAGLGRRWSVPARGLRSLPAAPGDVVPGFTEPARELQRDLARAWDGPLRRPSWWWDWKYSDSEHRCYTLVVGGEPQGLLGVRVRPVEPWGQDLVVSDFWARDTASGRALLRFLGGFGSMAHTVHFDTGTLANLPALVWELPQHELREQGWYPWMLRLLDIPAALESRGWPRTVTGRLDLAITGPAAQRLVLEVADGRAVTSPGGTGAVALSPGQLAAWYAGTLDPPALTRSLGPLDDGIVELMGMLTRRTEVWLPDVF